MAEAILDRIKYDAYKINIVPVDPANSGAQCVGQHIVQLTEPAFRKELQNFDHYTEKAATQHCDCRLFKFTIQQRQENAAPLPTK